MAAFDPILFRQLPVIQKIVSDEAYLEAERRGCWVPPDDPVVRQNVCEVILRIGATLRESLSADLANAPQQIPLNDRNPPHAA